MSTTVKIDVKAGDKIQLTSCIGITESPYFNSIWLVKEIADGRIRLSGITGPNPGETGSIDVSGPWKYDIVNDDWDK
jgi:hypothetical protein